MILGGDLNSEDGEPAIVALDAAGFVDSRRRCCTAPGAAGSGH